MVFKKGAFENGNDDLRMYGLVPYNLSPIQQGIQFGHAVVEYANQFYNDEDYQKWSQECKTFIILNGGTTNYSFQKNGTSLRKGTLNQHLETLRELDVKLAYFCESDLGYQLTGIVFLVDERIYNKEKYPEFDGLDNSDYLEWLSKFSDNSEKAQKIVDLREFLKQFRLA